MSGHPADGEAARQYPQTPPPQPHVHQWMPILNEWKEVTGYGCTCGSYQSV